MVRHVERARRAKLENEVGLAEGNIFQGELTMDQLLFNRPFPTAHAQYRGPVRGFSMCGPALTRAAESAALGANAAREILYDLRKPSSVPEGWQDD